MSNTKKYIIAGSILICVLFLTLITIIFNSNQPLLNVCKNNKWGLIDKNGKVKLPYQYEILGDFREGLAVACKDYKCGFINKKGKMVIKDYDSAFAFSNGLAVVQKEDKFGYINKKGKVIIPFEYEYAENYSDGLAPVCIEIGKCGYINKSNKIVIPFEYQKVNPFIKGVANVQSDNLWGAIDKKGQILIPQDYLFLGVLSENKITACKKMETFNGDRCGYINKYGETIIPFKFVWAADFSEGVGTVQGSDTKWFYIDKNGEKLFNKSYSITSAFSEGLAEICVNPTQCGFINKKGEPVITVKYEATSSFKKGIAAVLFEKKWGFINKKGKTVIPFEFDWTGMVF